MFIELTDVLRCPADHDEQFLVLLPDSVEARQVRRGHLGCLVCGQTFAIEDGVALFGEPTAGPAEAETGLDASALAALLGVQGPGGYVGLVGAAAARGEGLSAMLEGVHLVGINPPAGTTDSAGLSLLRGTRIPIRSRALRAVALGGAPAADPEWVAEAVRVVLPGLRVVGEGPEPATPGLEVVASAEGAWVAVRR